MNWKSNNKDLIQARRDTDKNPTDAQKKSGNYRMGSIKWNGLRIKIENPAGSIRRGRSSSGKKWETPMVADYGYVGGTESEADGDHIDVFIGPDLNARLVHIIDQRDPKTKKFDEHKCVIGCWSASKAKELYLAHYEKGWKGFMGISSMTVDKFVDWVHNGKSSHPLSESVMIMKLMLEALSSPDYVYLPNGERIDSGMDDAWDFVIVGKVFLIGQFGSHYDMMQWLRGNAPSHYNRNPPPVRWSKTMLSRDDVVWEIMSDPDGGLSFADGNLSGRLWTKSKVISFWDHDAIDYSAVIEQMMQSINQDPDQYAVAEESRFIPMQQFMNQTSKPSQWKELAKQQHTDEVIKRKISSGGMGSKVLAKQAYGTTPAQLRAATTTSESLKPETILYGVRIGSEDWQEEIITTNPSKIKEAQAWAEQNGFDRFRVANIDLSTPPDFSGIVKRKQH